MIISLGILLRLIHYFYNRSLWIDEVYLSTSFLHLDFLELASGPLDSEQKAPLGFLWATKLFVVLFGPGEMALRAFPLLCGLISLVAALPTLRHFIPSPAGVALALAAICFSPVLVYHTVEAKQYSTELLASLLAVNGYIFFQARLEIKWLVLWGIFGALLLWFSFSSIFVLGGIAATVVFIHLKNRSWKTFSLLLIPFGIWLVSLIVNYVFFLKDYDDSAWLVEWFRERNSFMPFPPLSLTDLMWYVKRPFTLMDYPLGLSWFPGQARSTAGQVILRMALIPVALMFYGAYKLYKKNATQFFIVVLPITLHLLASALEVYPFFERLTVYLSPLLIILIVTGCLAASQKLLQATQRPLLFYILPALVISGAIGNSVVQTIRKDLLGGYKNWEQREMYTYIQKHVRNGDLVYIYWNSKWPYYYYRQAYHLDFKAMVGGDFRRSSKSLNEYHAKLKQELNSLKQYKRIWFVYMNYPSFNLGDDIRQFNWYYQHPEHLESLPSKLSFLGKRIDTFQTRENINAYLYETR